MTTYTDVFGGDTIPPSEYAYALYVIAEDEDFRWPSEYDGTFGLLIASITELNPSSSGLTVTLPSAEQVSVGRDILFRNTGSYSIDVVDADGGAVATIAAGEAQYVYVADNSTAAGLWHLFTYGTGTSSADASALAGDGLEASSGKLRVSSGYQAVSGNYTILTSDRGKLLEVITGSITASLPLASAAGDGYYVYVHNSASGTMTVDGNGSETVDGGLTKTLAPGESAVFICNGLYWLTVGFGRDAEFVFSEFVVDMALTSVNLTSAQIAGRMIRLSGTASANVTVTLPSLDNIYFVNVEAGLGGFQATFTTGSGATVSLTSNVRTALYCDGLNVTTAISTAVTSAVLLDDGSAITPSLRFALDPDTGLFRPGNNQIGFALAGAELMRLNSSSGRVTVYGDSEIRSGTPRLDLVEADAPAEYNTTALLRSSNSFYIQTRDSTGSPVSTDYLVVGGSLGAFQHIWRTNDSERMRLTSDGRLGIGVTNPSEPKLQIGGSATGTAWQESIWSNLTIASDVTGGYYGIRHRAATQAASFTLPSLHHFFTDQVPFGSGSTVVAQYGYTVTSSLTGATNNYGFYGDIPAGTGRWNFYAGGSADNYFSGKVLVGDSNVGVSVFDYPIQEHVNSSTSGMGITSSSSAGGGPNIRLGKSRGSVATPASVQNGDETGLIRFLGHDGTNWLTTAQIASFVDAAPGTNDMPGRLVFYTTNDGESSATERMRLTSDGRLAIGTTSSAEPKLAVNGTATGSVFQSGVWANMTIASDVTSGYFGIRSRATTQAVSFTLPHLYHFYAEQTTFGAGSTVTNQYGFFASAALSGATNNYGFYADIANGSNRWNFYGNSTAPSFFAGDLYIGQTSTISPGVGNTTAGIGFDAGFSTSFSRSSSPTININRSTSTGDLVTCRYNGSQVGSISVTASTTAYNTSSDYRLKENVVPITGATARVMMLRPRRFNFLADPDTVVDGFIAHEAQAVVPEAVHGAKDAVDDEGNPIMQGIDQSKLVPLLTAALQEALMTIDDLKMRVEELERVL